MANIFFKDAVTAANLDPNAKYAVFYADGLYANHAAVAQRCPHAKLYGITTRGLTGHGIFACDSEAGDMTVAEALAWTEEQIKLGVDLICNYANLDRWLHQGLLAGIQALESKYHVHIRKWVADFNNVAQIQPWADAEQYSDPGPVDLDVALASFFGNVAPVIHEWSAELQVSVPSGSSGVLTFVGSVDLATGHWTIHGAPGHPHWSGPGGGQWRIQGEPLDSKPLGGN